MDRDRHRLLTVPKSKLRMKKRPRDPSQLAKLITDIAAGESPDTESEKRRKALTTKKPQGSSFRGKAKGNKS